MNILISGATGMVGTAVDSLLSLNGHRVVRLVRVKPQSIDEVEWHPATGEIDRSKLEDLDAVIHLAGENIASGRWTVSKKAKIKNSRVQGTVLLSKAVASLKKPPKVFISASAIGYYGDRGETLLDESSPPGKNFLSEVCVDWEEATEPAVRKGIRVVPARFGMILSASGGALEKMLLPFRLGLGGVLGNGWQYMSWITLDDVVGAIQHVLSRESLKGPVNLVAPKPVTNLEFTKTLGKILHRPTIFPMPAFVACMAFGEMADELLLASTRVEPKKLLTSGYQFRHPELEGALQGLIGK